MRIDIIVPNFDDSSDEVTLSAWYKKVGDKISKNEVIADAETAKIACGITSSYDCILTKIFVKEGEIISQGTKIAVIDTDVNADAEDIRRQSEAEQISEKSSEISMQVEEDVEEKRKSVELMRLANSVEKKEEKKDDAETSGEYSLSVDIGDLSSNGTSLVVTNDEEEVAEAALELEELVEADAVALNVVATENGTERKDDEILSEKLIDDIAEYREEKIINIINTAETKAREEASALREKIMEEARKQALLQSEELKIKILHEYEEKALKDASEMRQKIVQGSLSEAESTRAKIINEAKEKAEKEAEKLRQEILNSAKQEAAEKASASISNAIAKARESAKQEAEILSKEIIEKAIQESKAEAKAIKKDILHSANKHAAKESESIVKETIKEARRTSSSYAKELVESTTKLASKEAENLKNEIVQAFAGEIMTSVNHTLREMKKNIHREIKHSIGSEMESVSAELNREMHHIVSSELPILKTNARKKMKEAENSRSNDAEMEAELRKTLLEDGESELEEQNEIVRKLIRSAREDTSPEMYADNWNKPKFFSSPNDRSVPIDILTRRINEKMKSCMDSSVISTVSNEVDMSAVIALEKTFGEAFSRKHSTRLGFTPFFVSASIAALKQYRVFNSHIREDEIIYKNNFDISIITCGNDGVLAPVIRDADLLSIAEIERSMIALSRRAVEGTLSVEEVSGGTFTLINAGIYGSLIGTDLLTPPQVATLSVHRMHNRPVATDGGVEIKPMLYISLSYDHRVADTKKASEFLLNVKNYVENPGWQILGL